MHEHGNTIENMQIVGSTCSSSNTIQTVDETAARACRTTVANGTNKPRWPQYHQVHKSLRGQPRFPVEPEVYRFTKVSRCKEQGEIPRTDAFAKLSVVCKQLIYTITNLACKLGLVTKLVELNIPSRSAEVSGPSTLKGMTLRTGGIN